MIANCLCGVNGSFGGVWSWRGRGGRGWNWCWFRNINENYRVFRCFPRKPQHCWQKWSEIIIKRRRKIWGAETVTSQIHQKCLIRLRSFFITSLPCLRAFDVARVFMGCNKRRWKFEWVTSKKLEFADGNWSNELLKSFSYHRETFQLIWLKKFTSLSTS